MNSAKIRQIELDDIQLLRYWRNLEHVRSKMVTSQYIDRDEQRNWFKSLKNDDSKYYIFSMDYTDVGCVNLNKINQIKKSFEVGIFCGNQSYLSHWINVWAYIKVYNFAFFELDLNTSFVTILLDNKAALRLNKSLGYESIGNLENNIGRFSLSRETYVQTSKKIQQFLQVSLKQKL